jgi:hypothetical protein
LITDIAALVDPMREGDFLECLNRRKLTFVRGSDPKRFTSLVDWATLSHLLESGAVPQSQLRILRESMIIDPGFYSTDGRVDPHVLSTLMEQGMSVIFGRLDDYVAPLRILCDAIERRIGEIVYAGALVTSGGGGALKLHFDRQDLLILQVYGTKRWQIHDKPVCNPVDGMPEPKPEGVVAFDETLRPGDWLFLPAGHWHHCENGPDRSLHLGIFLEPDTGIDLVRSLAAELLSDALVRLPLARGKEPAAMAAHENALKSWLIEKIQQLSVVNFLESRNNLRETRHLLDLGARNQISDRDVVTDRFRRRPTLPVWRDGETAEIGTAGGKHRVDPLELQILHLLVEQGAMEFSAILTALPCGLTCPGAPREVVEKAVHRLRSIGLVAVS